MIIDEVKLIKASDSEDLQKKLNAMAYDQNRGFSGVKDVRIIEKEGGRFEAFVLIGTNS